MRRPSNTCLRNPGAGEPTSAPTDRRTSSKRSTAVSLPAQKSGSLWLRLRLLHQRGKIVLDIGVDQFFYLGHGRRAADMNHGQLFGFGHHQQAAGDLLATVEQVDLGRLALVLHPYDSCPTRALANLCPDSIQVAIRIHLRLLEPIVADVDPRKCG